MKIAVLGTGSVGNTLAKSLMSLGHQVQMGSRSKDNEKLIQFIDQNQGSAGGTFKEVAAWCEMAINCTKGSISLSVLAELNAELKNKVLLDLSNPLEQVNGHTVLSESTVNTTSLGEQIQMKLPDTHVVKALNTMWCGLMVNPNSVANGEHDTFICGNSEEAKNTVKSLLHEFGWKEAHIIDLGNIDGSRATEMYLPLWLRMYGHVKTAAFNVKIVK